MLRTLLLPILTVSICAFASADSLTVMAGGTFSSTDTPDTYVTPGDTFSLSFVVDSNPVIPPGDSIESDFDVPVTDFMYTVGGTSVDLAPTEITFYTGALGGGFQVDFGNNGGDYFLFGPDQLFTGPTSAPTFATGTFDSDSWTFLDDNNVDAGTASPLEITSTTPEPSSIPILLCAGLALVAVRFKKFAGTRQ
ncbi:MAG TPA: hypothetical protein VME17_04770 [Bryobacteraceae bacterium]|nr:hypothetical protein [Bryobacteraceae bacterium]